MSEETITSAPSTETASSQVEETVTSAPVTTQEVKTTDPKSMKSDEIKDLLNNPPKIEAPVEDKKTEQATEEWFDKERGFKTKEDMVKSYTEAQNKIRETSEQLKQFEQFKEQAEHQLQELSKKAESAPLSPEDAQKKQAIEAWKNENKDSLDFIKNLVKEDLKKETVRETIEKSAIQARQGWKQDFDKDEARKTLWPKMEEIYAKKGNQIFQEFMHNPFPYLEAMAFRDNFSSIAAKIKQEAVEQFKAEQKQAAEVARTKQTATPGGLKINAGESDVSKMSSADLAALLPRGE